MSAPRSTLAAPACLVREVRKSKFVANAAGVSAPDEALAFIEAVSDHSATHNCWAYRIGLEYRFNDDGEPGGTAGKPILQAIDGQGLDHVAVVVTRWFGGVKLGAGGLIRAYGGCAAECLRTAPKRALIDRSDVELDLAFPVLPVLHSRLPELGAEKIGERFSDAGAVLHLRLPSDRVDALRALLADLSRGRAQLRILDTR
jgi:uncharacterized YigZ family protein